MRTEMQRPQESPAPAVVADAPRRFPQFPELLRLSDRQRTAVVLLVLGDRIGNVAEKIGVCRTTVWRWRQNPDFRHALDKARELAFADSIDQIGALAPRYVDRIDRAIHSGNDNAAFRLLRLIRVDRSFHRALGLEGP